MSKKLIFLTSFVLVLVLAGTNAVFAGFVWEDRIHGENDDVEESVSSGSMYMDSGDLEMPDGQVIGLRFMDVGVPPGAAIANAYVRFQCDELVGGTEAVSLLIEGDLSPNAAAFAEVTNNVTSRSRTTAQVVWVPVNWFSVGQKDQTSNIASVIEEIVGQPGWAMGNSLVLIISDDPANPSTGIRVAEAGVGGDSAMLHIEFMSKSAMEPGPADGAIIDRTWVTLYWTPGYTAASHNVYFGENSVDVDAGAEGTFLSNVADAYLIVGYPGHPYPDGLAPGVTHYWRIDEVEADDTTTHKGPLWSFSIPSSTARNPNPPDRFKSADRSSVLSWTPGFDAKLHTVYFGESFDDVNSATGGMLQGVATYTPTPSPLAEKTVYYWRVDEFDGVETHKGDVWSFRTSWIADPNLIGWWTFDEGQGTVAFDYSGYGNHGTLGGDPQWVAGYFGGALELDGSGDYVAIDAIVDYFPANNNFSVGAWIKTTQTNDGNVIGSNHGDSSHDFVFGVDDGNLLVEADTSNQYPPLINDDRWHHIAYVRDGDRAYAYTDGVRVGTETPTANPSREDRWSIGQEWDNGSPSDLYVGLVDDVRFYNKPLTDDEIKQIMKGDALLAWDPSPHNNATVDINRARQPLTWSPGEDVAQHDVYFGTDEMTVEIAETSDTTGIYRVRQIGTTYTPPEGVEFGGGPYYWRIDEYNNDASISTGKLWNFTVADYLIVDDFEDYNDYEPDEVWRTWVDGYGVATNGSTAGYPDPDFLAGEHYVETTIVHSGAQAMPFFYSNTGTATYSEGTRTFAVPQNWTQEGVQALVLYFYGTAGNTGQLYVKVSGVKVAYPGDAADIEQAQWNQWNIDLASLNPQSVTSMIIGMDDIGASGTLYFDNIRLYRLAP